MMISIKHLAIAMAGSVLVTAASTAQEGEFARFAEHAEVGTGPAIDYTAWSEMLRGIVFDVGHSDRQSPSMRRTSMTGTRLSRASGSRYRYEGNRVILHLVEDNHAQAISAYRAELEAIPSIVPLSELNSNEQLAYWLNLHNVVLIDELIKQYPVGNIARARIDGEPLLDAEILTIEGVSLSLNDIRYHIVADGWQDPRIIYGFFLGAVGGPSLSDEAFEGGRVWTQLESNAREFVNALRGVDAGFRQTELSPYYEMHADLFPGGTPELKAHLAAFGNDEVDALIMEIGDTPAFLDFDWRIADLTNGYIGCGTEGMLNNGTAGNCSVLPSHTVDLMGVVIERRLEFLRNGEIGRVTVRDLPTDPNQEPTAPAASEGEEEQPSTP